MLKLSNATNNFYRADKKKKFLSNHKLDFIKYSNWYLSRGNLSFQQSQSRQSNVLFDWAQFEHPKETQCWLTTEAAKHGGWRCVTTSQLLGLRFNRKLGLLSVWSFWVCSVHVPASVWVSSRFYNLPPPIKHVCRWIVYDTLNLAVSVQYVLMCDGLHDFHIVCLCAWDMFWVPDPGEDFDQDEALTEDEWELLNTKCSKSKTAQFKKHVKTHKRSKCTRLFYM